MLIEFHDFWIVHYLQHLLEGRQPHRIEASNVPRMLYERGLEVPARASRRGA